MSRWKDTAEMYWPLGVALVLFLPAAWHYYSLGQWELYMRAAGLAVLGFASTAFSDELSSWTGSYGWTTETYRNYPSDWVRAGGILLQLSVLIWGFR